MKKSSPGLFARNYRLLVVCAILTVLVAFSVSVSSHSGEGSLSPGQSQGAAQKANPGNFINSVLNFPMPLPTLSVTMTDQIVAPDGGEVGKAGVGEKIRYTVTIQNTHPTDPATNLKLEDTIDPNTTLVGGSIVISPLAANETYQSVGNMTLTSSAIGADCNANSLRSVTCNDTLRGATLSGFGNSVGNANANATGSSASITGGSVTLNADGTFVFNPTAGFEGDAEFWYTLTNSTVTPALTDVGKVTIQVGGANGMVWFVSSGGGSGATFGTQTNPFSLSGFQALNNGSGTNPADNDTVYLFEGNHNGTVTLRAGQKFLGQDTTVAVDNLIVAAVNVGAPTAKPGNAYPAINPNTAGTPTVAITNVGTPITLGTGNFLSGFTVGNAATAISSPGGGFGTLNVREVVINNTTGRGLVLGSGTVNSNATFPGFGSITTGGGTSGISLTSVNGTLAMGATSVSGATGTGIDIQTSAASISFGDTSVSKTSAGMGVNLNGNSGNITFNALGITTSSGAALTGTNNTGSIAVTTNSAGISATGGAAINIAGTAANSLTPLNLNFNTVSANSTVSSLVLTNTSGTLNAANGGSLSGAGGGVITFSVSAGSVSVTWGNTGTISGNSSGTLLDVSNGHTGTLTFNNTIDTAAGYTGNGLQFNNADGSYNFNGTTTLDLGDAGIDILADSTGTFNFASGTAITRPANAGGNVGFNLANSNANVTYNGNITMNNSTAGMIAIDNHDGGTITFQNGSLICTNKGNVGISISNSATSTINFTNPTKTLDTGSGNAVSLTGSNTGKTINFTNGNLIITTSSGQGFRATGGETVTVTGSNNTIATTTGTAVNIATPSNIGVNGVTFKSVTVNNGASNSATNAIILNGTTGAFTVTGDGSQTSGLYDRDGSGGTINRTTGHSVLLTGAQNVTLRQMNITNTASGGTCPGTCTANGVNATANSGNIVLSAVHLQNLGGHGWYSQNITGVNRFDNNGRVENWQTNNATGLYVDQNVNFTSYTIQNSLFTTSATGGDGLTFDGNGGSGIVSVLDSEFTLIDQDGVQINNDGSGTLTAVVKRNNFHDADATGGDGNNTIFLAIAGSGTLNFVVGADATASLAGNPTLDRNTFKNLSRSQAVTGMVAVNAVTTNQPAGTRLNGTIRNNLITNDAGFDSRRDGISFGMEANGGGGHGIHKILVSDNTISNVGLTGMRLLLNSTDTATGTGGTMTNTNFTISNNTISNVGLSPLVTPDSQSGIEIETNFSGFTTGGDLITNILLQNNSVTNNNNSAVGDTLDVSNRGGDNASTIGTMNLTLFGNNFTNQNAGGRVVGIICSGLTTAVGCTLNLDMNSDNVAGNANDTTLGASAAGDIQFSESFTTSTFNIEDLGANAAPAFVSARNNNDTVTVVNGSIGTTGEVTMPSLPDAFATAFNFNPFKTNDSQLAANFKVNPVAAVLVSLGGAEVVASAVEGDAKASSSEGKTSAQAGAMLGAIISSPARVEIEKGAAFALAHAGPSPTLGSRVSSFISSIASTVSPTAHAAPAPMPALEVNESLGTLPANKSVTVVFDVTVNPPHPFASYTNNATIKADGVADIQKQVVTPGDRYNTSTSVAADPAGPSFENDNVKFTATVTPTETDGTAHPAGNLLVQFKDGLNNLGSPVNCVADGDNCKAELNTNTLPPGTWTSGNHSITAQYLGGTHHEISTSSPALAYTVSACTSNPQVTVATDNAGGVNPAIGAGTGTLRQAIIDVCPGTTISFDPALTAGGAIEIDLEAALPDITRNMTIQGPGAGLISVLGSQVGAGFRVFNVTIAATDVKISGLTISGGGTTVGLGGGGVNNVGTLTLTEVTVKGNSSASTGGGIQNTGTLTIERSTVSNNTSLALGGGGIYNTGTMTIRNSTIASNVTNAATGNGGGILNNSAGVTTVESSTIALNNSSATGGGIFNTAGTFNIANTIVGDNTASVANADLSGTFSSQDYNLFETTPSGFVLAAHDKTGNPLLQNILTNNGGPTLTLALQDGSPAIDAGNTALTVDQRNQPREVNNPNVTDATGGDASDIGAYEAAAPPSAPDLKATSDSGDNDDDVTNLTNITFTIGGVQNGETVSLFRGTTFVVDGVAGGTSIELIDATAPEGTHTYTAKRTVNGGTSTSSAGLSVTIDATDPATPTIDLTTDTGNSSTDNITNAATLSFNIGSVEAGATVELLRDGVSVASQTTIAGGTVTLTDSPAAGNFTYTARQTDAAANDADSAGLPVGVDRTGPAVSNIARNDATPTGAATVNYTVTFDENVTGVDTADFAVTTSGVTSASVTNVAGVSPTNSYVVTVNTGSGDGTVRLDVADNDTIADVAGNPLGGAGDNGDFTTGEVYAVDKTDPVVTSIVRVHASPTNLTTVDFTVTFSENVSGVDMGDFALTTTGSIAGHSITNLTGASPGAVYTVTVNTGTGDGTIRLDIDDDNSIVDQASKPLGGAGDQDFTTGQVYTVDKTAPTISIGAPSVSASNGSGNVTYTVTYADASSITSTLAVGNITLNKTGTADATVGVSAGPNPETRIVTLSGITGNGTLGISIAANTASDAAGNNAPAAGPSTTFVVDTVVPTVSTIVKADADPTGAASVNFTVTFSENVSGVDTTDFALTTTGGISGASVTNVTGVSPTNSYTVTVNTGSGDGTLRLDVADNNTIVDQASSPLGGAGVQNFTGGETYTVDKTNPSVSSIVRVVGSTNPTNAATVDFTVTFSEDVTGVDTTDFALDTIGVAAPSITNVTGASPGSVYTVTVNTGTGSGTVSIDLNDNNSIVDQALKPIGGAGVQNFTGGEAYTIDKTGPTVDINRAAGQADSVTNATEINFTATFNEPVTDFDDVADVNFSGAGASAVTITPVSSTVYNIKVTGMNTSGTVTVDIPAGAAQDSFSQSSSASTHTDNTVEYTQDATASYVVNSLANTEDGDCANVGIGNGCTLREAILLANLDAGTETISFAPALTAGGPQTILLNGPLGALPDIVDSVTIQGPTNNSLTIDGNNSVRIFNIGSGLTVNISNLTVRNGDTPSFGGGIYNAGILTLDKMVVEDNDAQNTPGGGIFNEPGATLTITNSTIDGNRAIGAVGGGIFNLGDLTIRNSTLSNNYATTVAGIGGDGGAIDSDGGTLNIYNSTISGNKADGGGGGIHHCGNSTAVLVNVTVTGNRSATDDVSPGGGGGIEQVSFNSITLRNTIVAGNFRGTGSTGDDVSGDFTIQNSLIQSPGSATFTDNGGNLLNQIAQLRPLASNGGPTMTHLLLPGSPAINTGSNALANAVSLTTDQRGTGFQRIVNTTVDMGAVEGNYAITATAGTPQSAGIGTAFATQLQATVTESGNAQNGIPVTFTAPNSGASGTFASSATVNTNASGVATAPVFTANGTAGGPYNVAASLAGGTPSVNFILTNTKVGQTITFGALPNKAFGDANFAISATASSGLPVSFAASGQCTVSGNTVHLTGAGSCTITASQAGNANYNAAPNVQRTFSISKANQTITFNALANKTFGNADFTVAATASSGLAVTFAATGQCTVSGSTVHLTGAGSCTITASQAGNSSFNAATSVQQSFTIAKAAQTITFAALANKTFGNADFNVSATATSGLAVSFAASGQCTVSGNTVHLTGAGSCTITASQAGNSNFNAAADVPRTFSISKANQTITFNALANKTFGNADFNVSATATSGLAVSFAASGNCTVSGNTVHLTGAGSCTITASQAGNSSFNAAPDVQRTFSIAKAATTTGLTSSLNPSAFGQNVTFTATVSSSAGTPTGTVQFKDGAVNLGAPVALNGSGVATFSTTSLSAGTHTITAEYGGSANFAAGSGTLSGGQVVGAQASLTIDNVSVTEGNSGTKNAAFTVTLSQASAVTVTVSFATANGTATVADNDYQSASGTLTFNAGQLTKTINVVVVGDTKNEPNETFFVNLSNAQNATISDNQGQGTITNDDGPGVQLSSTSYTVNEGLNNTPQGFTSLSVEVIRTGDTSQPATVKYITSDASGGNECNQVTGQASQRCDYILVGATLRFAAGESTKTINIPIINDGYNEGAEFFSIELDNAVGATVGSPSLATITIQDDAADSTPTTSANNPYLSNQFFVRQNYLDFLGRDADQAGFTDWVNVLNNCGPQQGFLGAPPTCDRAHVAHGFFGSEEFIKSGFLIYRMFEVGMNRLPLYREFIPDMASLSGFNLTPAQHQQNVSDYLQEFTSKQEFVNRFQDVSQPAQAAQFIERLEQTAGVTLPTTNTTLPGQPTQYGRQELINLRAAGQLSLGQTLKAFVEQKVVYDRFFQRGHVTMLYFAYLRRDPSLGDPNLVGWNDWVNVFTNGGQLPNGTVIQPMDIHHLVFGFIYSDEYRKRFGQP